MGDVTSQSASQPEAVSATTEDLERLDYFRDLQDRYLEFAGLEARWLPKATQPSLLDRESHLKLHYLMSLTRAVEEMIDRAFRAGHVPGTAFFGRGNEASSVGGAVCLREDEWLVPMHRNCGAHLAKGHPPQSIMAHYFGREGGPARGREGNLHVGYRPAKITQLISHIGTMVPIAAGLAWAEKTRGRSAAVLTYIGDGGTSTGDFHEGINLAAVHELPLVIVIDNNQYAYKTALSDQFACATLAQKAPGYGMRGYLIDGTDVCLVHRVCSEALDLARAGGGPTLIESVTMRLSGHSVYDRVSDYVDLEDHARWEAARDPVPIYDQFLIDSGIATAQEIAASHARARLEAEAARDEALKSPFPRPETVTDDVYSD